MLKIEKGGLWGKPVTDPKARRAEIEARVREIVWKARRAATGRKKESLYSVTSARTDRKPLTSALRFMDDLIEANAPWGEIEALAGLLMAYVRIRRADLRPRSAGVGMRRTA
jgi:hypothetical protein